MLQPADKTENLGYPTQKPEDLLSIIVGSTSSPGDLVLDCFLGSGTTAAVAQKLGRRWIGCDINKGAIQTSARRLRSIVEEQCTRTGTTGGAIGQSQLPEPDGAGKAGFAPTLPAQLAFTVWRVNEYDLAIQHNEAVALACEHIGVVRSRTDSFFDGVLGKELVKVVPFDHPIAPTDLDDVAQEMRNRPSEDRDVVVVGLGKELACDGWLTDHNRKGAPNKVRLIELRTDPRYGRFFAHEPATACIKVRRADGRVTVVTEDFVSPTIVRRLQDQAGLITPQITDWRAMVDSVFIDPAYDGQTFNVVLADVPERRDDLVSGTYEWNGPSGTVAVKVTDALGEEIFVTCEG